MHANQIYSTKIATKPHWKDYGGTLFENFQKYFLVSGWNSALDIPLIKCVRLSEPVSVRRWLTI